MWTNFENYFHENIIEKFKEYKSIIKSRKKGLNKDLRVTLEMASVLYHLREHLPKHINQDLLYYTNLCSDYELIGNIANVAKHKEINRNNPKLTKLDDVYEVEVITEFSDSHGKYYCSEKIVQIYFADKSTRNVHEIILNVINMWIDELFKVGIIKYIKPFNFTTFKIPKRWTRLEKMDMLARKWLWISHTIKLQRYNYEKWIVEPIDLTWSTLKLHIYEQKYDLTLDVRNPKTNESNKVTIKVNELEKKKIEKLNSETEKINYFITLAKREWINITYLTTSSLTQP